MHPCLQVIHSRPTHNLAIPILPSLTITTAFLHHGELSSATHQVQAMRLALCLLLLLFLYPLWSQDQKPATSIQSIKTTIITDHRDQHTGSEDMIYQDTPSYSACRLSSSSLRSRQHWHKPISARQALQALRNESNRRREIEDMLLWLLSC